MDELHPYAFLEGGNKMDKKTETKLIECHILMCEALKGYEDRAFQSNKIFEIRQYSNQLPEDMNNKITEYVKQVIRPMVYDADYWSFIEKDENYGAYDDDHHFIINSDFSLERIIFRKYHYIHDLLEELSKFMYEEFGLDYDS
ncbi:MAG: hypothetical protein MJ105_09605 [Lachnospiraceae bacterium]|nr:hypothetical protein [Lachnospiraceae bacterium]